MSTLTSLYSNSGETDKSELKSLFRYGALQNDFDKVIEDYAKIFDSLQVSTKL